jgi:hypothetical protein
MGTFFFFFFLLWKKREPYNVSQLSTLVATLLNPGGLAVTGKVAAQLAVVANRGPMAVAGKVPS